MRSTVDKYLLVHTSSLYQYPVVLPYWQALYDHHILHHRMPEVINPTTEDVEKMYRNKTMCFSVMDLTNGKMAAETMLTDFHALSAQVHFSVHPDYFGKSVEIARCGAEQLFNIRDRKTGRNLTTLIGVTPVTSPLAIRMIKKVGYKEIGVLTNVYLLANNGNKVVNGLLTMLTQEDISWR